MGDENKVEVETVGVYRLRLDSSFFQFSTWMRPYMYYPFRWYRISISLLNRSIFTVTLDNEMLSLLFKPKVIGTRILIDGYMN